MNKFRPILILSLFIGLFKAPSPPITIESYDGTAVINGKYSDYVFYITDKGSLTLKNIEFVNTEYSTVKTYGAIVNYGNLNVLDSSFSNAVGLRAGIILNYGTLLVNNLEFKNNSAKYYGGAVTNCITK